MENVSDKNNNNNNETKVKARSAQEGKNELTEFLNKDLSSGIEGGKSSISVLGFKIPVPRYGAIYELAKFQANLIKNTFNPDAPRIGGNESSLGYDSRYITGAAACFVFFASSYLVPAAVIFDGATVLAKSGVLSRGGDSSKSD